MEKHLHSGAIIGVLATACGQYTCPTVQDVATDAFAAEAHINEKGEVVAYSHLTGDLSTELNPGGIDITLRPVPSGLEEIDAELSSIITNVQNAWLTPLNHLGVNLSIGEPTEEVDCETLLGAQSSTETQMELGEVWICALPITGSNGASITEKEPCSTSLLAGAVGVNELSLDGESRNAANMIVSQQFAHTLGLHPFQKGLLSYSTDGGAYSHIPDPGALKGLTCLYYNPELPYYSGFDFQKECASSLRSDTTSLF